MREPHSNLSRTVALTHPDRLLWPDEGVTKQALADYYASVWPRMAAFVVGRPLALLRAPDGIKAQTFFQKHPWPGLAASVERVEDPAAPGAPLIIIRSFDGLLALVQGAALEIHPWGSTIADPERPDTLVMDLDPGEGVVWEAVCDGARETRARLEAAGLAAFVKTSGGKGLHIVAPLKPKAAWPEAKAFAKSIADAMAAESPRRYVATIAKAKRRGRILVDYLRNQRGATAVAAYSARARTGAPVSMPVRWEELERLGGSKAFTLLDVRPRLEALERDAWDGFRDAEAPIDLRR